MAKYGKPEIVVEEETFRTCLKCQTPFLSTHSGNRICAFCSSTGENLGKLMIYGERGMKHRRMPEPETD